MALILGYQDRGMTRDITITKADGSIIVPTANDVIRAIIGREGKLGVNNADAQLVVASDAATVAGSTFLKNTPSNGINRLRLDATDLNFASGVYTLIVELFDRADASELKNVSRQIFSLEET